MANVLQFLDARKRCSQNAKVFHTEVLIFKLLLPSPQSEETEVWFFELGK